MKVGDFVMYTPEVELDEFGDPVLAQIIEIEGEGIYSLNILDESLVKTKDRLQGEVIANSSDLQLRCSVSDVRKFILGE